MLTEKTLSVFILWGVLMNPSFFSLEEFLTKEEKSDLIEAANTVEFKLYTPSVGEQLKTEPINVHPFPFRDHDSSGLLKLNPNSTQPWHVDGRTYAVIIHPLIPEDDYAPLCTKHGEATTPVILNTQAPHAVFNNDNVRVNLQIPLFVPYEDLYNDRNHNIWKVINRLY